jgi:hypothetical protein
MKGIDSKQWQLSNLVKLKVAGMEDFSIWEIQAETPSS